MRKLLSTRHGFFAFASVISYAMLLVIETEHRWVAFGLGSLYAVLAALFFFEELGRALTARKRITTPRR